MMLLDRLRHLPFEALGFAKVDHHRALRNGCEIIGEGKTPALGGNVVKHLATSDLHGASEKQFAAVKKKVHGVEFRDLACAIVQRDPTKYG